MHCIILLLYGQGGGWGGHEQSGVWQGIYGTCYLLILERDDIGPHEGENQMRGEGGEKMVA